MFTNYRWSKCQSVWANLYSLLESCGEWLDTAERQLEEAHDPALPFKDLKQKVRDLDQQVRINSLTSSS